MNFLAATARSLGEGGTELDAWATARRRAAPRRRRGLQPGAPSALGIRPEHLRVARAKGPGPAGHRQSLTEHLGGVTFFYGTLASEESLTIEVRAKPSSSGVTVPVRLDPAFCHLFDGEGQAFPPRHCAGRRRGAAAMGFSGTGDRTRLAIRAYPGADPGGTPSRSWLRKNAQVSGARADCDRGALRPTNQADALPLFRQQGGSSTSQPAAGFTTIRRAPRALSHLESRPAREGMRRLIRSPGGLHRHPEFLSLLVTENLHQGQVPEAVPLRPRAALAAGRDDRRHPGARRSTGLLRHAWTRSSSTSRSRPSAGSTCPTGHARRRSSTGPGETAAEGRPSAVTALARISWT